MTLPSQTARSIRVTNTRPASRGYRPKAVRRRRLALAVLLIAALALIFGGWRALVGLGNTPQTASAGDTTQSTPSDPDPSSPMGAGMTPADDQPITRNTTPDDDDVIGRQARDNDANSTDRTNRIQPPASRAQTDTPVLTMGQPRTNNTQHDSATRTSPTADASITNRIESAVDMIAANPVEARDQLNRALHNPNASASQKLDARRALQALNEELFFSPRIVPGDPLTDKYTVQSGDTLGAIAARNNLMIDWRLLMRVNGITDARRIRVGQTLKLILGPYHAKIDKSDYRLDIYAGQYDADGNRLYITSYDIGLGEYDSTPVGTWVVRTNSKLLNPAWTNPRTGEKFSADDPENPVGECWLGLDGTDESTSQFLGYGIHGTIEPDSIGTDASMGCIRLLPGEIDQVWELLVEDVSTVEIVR